MEKGIANGIISFGYMIFGSMRTMRKEWYSGCQMDNWCAEVRWEWAVCIRVVFWLRKLGALLSLLAGVALLQPGGQEITGLTERRFCSHGLTACNSCPWTQPALHDWQQQADLQRQLQSCSPNTHDHSRLTHMCMWNSNKHEHLYLFGLLNTYKWWLISPKITKS